LNRTANKGNRNNNGTDKENTQNKTAECREQLSLPAATSCCPAPPDCPAPPHPEPSMTAHGIPYHTLFGQVGSALPAVFPPGFW